jgi:hypothetical protein
MGKIALSQHTSLDGVIQSPGSTDVPFKSPVTESVRAARRGSRLPGDRA